jgi:natural product biosynthesis luciferase-like monooxygenase protein
LASDSGTGKRVNRSAHDSDDSAAIATGPLSYGQRSLWFLHQLAPGESAYNVTLAARLLVSGRHVGAALCVPSYAAPPLLLGDINIPAIRASLQCLVDRHSSLRTVFTARRGKAIQEIRERQEVCFVHVDTSGLSHDEVIAKLVESSHKPFDLERGPLLRGGIYARPDDAILVLTLHHIIVDFSSLLTLLEELGAFYSAQRAGCDLVLPQRSTEYVDYCRWQSEILDEESIGSVPGAVTTGFGSVPEAVATGFGSVPGAPSVPRAVATGHRPPTHGEKLWTYWQNQLRGAPQVITLPFDRPRTQVQTFRGSSTRIDIGEDLTRALRATIAAEGGSLYTLLLAAFQALLCGWASQDEVVVGSPPIGKRCAEFDGVVGFFHNPIPLRGSISGNPTFPGFHATVRQTVAEALDHREYPFSLLVERLRASRDVSYSPIFQVMFVLYEAGGPSWLESLAGGARGGAHIGALELEFLDIEEKVSMLDLTLTVFEDENSVSAVLQYNTDLFDAGTADRILEDFRSLLSAISDDPAKPVNELLSMACSRPLECGATRLAATQLAALSPLFSRVPGLPPERAPRSGVAASGQPTSDVRLKLRGTCRGGPRVPSYAAPPLAPQVSHRQNQSILPDPELPPSTTGTKQVDFSLFYRVNRDGSSPRDRYSLLIDSARDAERMGFRAVWVAEQSEPGRGVFPSPAVIAAAIAAKTDRIQIRAVTIVSPLQSPVRAAEEWAVVDNLSNGRAGICFAPDLRGSELEPDPECPGTARFQRAKPPNSQTLEALVTEQVETLRRLWRGQTVAFDGPFGKPVAVQTLPKPIQADLPIWLFAGESSPEMFRLAGEIGAGILIEPVTAGLESVADRIKLYRQVWRDHGHGPGTANLPVAQEPATPPRSGDLSVAQEPATPPQPRSGDLSVAREPAIPPQPRSGHVVLILPTSDLEGTPESRLSVVERLGSIDIDEVACLLDFETDQKSILDGLRDLEALREANSRREGNEAEVPAFWEPPGYAAPIEQIESIPAQEIRERAQTRRAMLKRNSGLRKN